MFLNPAQAGKILGVTESTARLYARTGIVPARKIGRNWRFLEQDLYESGQPNCFTKEAQNPVRIGGSAFRSRGGSLDNRAAQAVKSWLKRTNKK